MSVAVPRISPVLAFWPNTRTADPVKSKKTTKIESLPASHVLVAIKPPFMTSSSLLNKMIVS
jgi:hypothetical protein